jgi:hypothetical protein
MAALVATLLSVSSCGRSEPAAPNTVTTPKPAAPPPSQVGATDDSVGRPPVDGTISSATAEPTKLPPPEGAQRLSEEFEVWIDPAEKAVIVDGQISLREGMLEMFACTRGTKEHESIVSANTRAFLVHAGLLQLGAEPGRPVQFVPEYVPPSGTEIEVLVRWIDEEGNEKTVRAQELIKDLRTEKEMAHAFVFAGSLFWKDPEDGKEYYMAEGGEFICVSNFGTAMLDIPVESSQSNEFLAFVTYTERIPPLGWPIRLVLKPKLDKKTSDTPMDQPKNANDPGR